MTFCLAALVLQLLSPYAAAEHETCLNGGTLSEEGCKCPPGFGGHQCQNRVPICWNNGTWDGLKCVCTSPYYGTSCEEVVSSLDIDSPPETVSAQVELTVTVTNIGFSEELKDWSSQEFQDFNDTFTKQMEIVYSGIPEYEGVNITKLSPGSVKVEHDVILKANFTPDYKDVLDKAIQDVESKIKTTTQEQISTNNTCETLLCFNETATRVQNISVTQYDPEEECREKAGQDFAEYFYVEYDDNGKPNCISRCEPNFNRSLNCNHGTCQLDRSGPRCYCLITDTEWYSGETCEFSTKKSLVYGLLGAAGAVVLIILAILLMFIFRSRRQVERQKSKVAQLYKWHEEDGGPAPGTFQNIGFDICEEQENYIRLDSIYSNFQPTLGHIDSETKIRIKRPQVIMTSI
ncbi:mucin-17 [Equus quagga]|uniref:mucin-17 n=1 Tax=Equus quagga TaxID=89248 RepID=UPI001EE2B053|nr:mucin-17 [Equus quagga]